MILYIENPIGFTKNLLKLINKFSKFAVYKINIQKSVVLLYAKCKLSERDIKKTILLTISPKRIKYLGMNLTKEVKDLYTENYKTLMEEIEEDTINGDVFFAYGLEELILLKCPCDLKQSTDSV